MIELKAQPGEFKFTLEITRAETGVTETVELIGIPIIEQENLNGSDTLNNSA